MEKPRLSSKIEEVEYHGVKFKVKREFYVSDELGEYTTTEQDQKWWDDMKRQYYEYLGKVISDAKYLDILEFIDPLIIIKDKRDKMSSILHLTLFYGQLKTLLVKEELLWKQ